MSITFRYEALNQLPLELIESVPHAITLRKARGNSGAEINTFLETFPLGSRAAAPHRDTIPYTREYGRLYQQRVMGFYLVVCYYQKVAVF